MKKVFIQIAKLSVSALSIAFLIGSGRLDFSQFSWTPFAWSYLVAAALVFVLAMSLAFVRHSILLRAAGLAIPVSRVLQAGFVSWFLNATLLGGFGFVSGDAVRIGWLLPHVEKKSALVGATLVDRVFGLLGIVVIAFTAFLICAPEIDAGSTLASAASWIYGIVAFGGMTVLFLLGLSITGKKPLLILCLLLSAVIFSFELFVRENSPRWWTAVIPPVAYFSSLLVFSGEGFIEALKRKESTSKIRNILIQFGEALVALRTGPLSLGVSLLLSVATHSLAVVTLFLVSRAVEMQHSPEFPHLFFSAPVASAVGMLPLPANGLGVGETAFDAALRMFQSETGEVIAGGAALFLSYRVLTVICGLSGLPGFLVGRKHSDVPT